MSTFIAAAIVCMLEVGCATLQAPDGPVATQVECAKIIARDESTLRTSLLNLDLDYFNIGCVEVPEGANPQELVIKFLGPKRGSDS